MEETLNAIREIMSEKESVSFAKQCKEEFIVYTVFCSDGSVCHLDKKHYTDSTMSTCKTNEHKFIGQMSIRDFVHTSVYKLLRNGYAMV